MGEDSRYLSHRASLPSTPADLKARSMVFAQPALTRPGAGQRGRQSPYLGAPSETFFNGLLGPHNEVIKTKGCLEPLFRIFDLSSTLLATQSRQSPIPGAP